MLFGHGLNFHWFYQRSRVDGLVGWRYLTNRSYRRQVRERWDSQPVIMTVTEVMAGAASILFPLAMAVGGFCLLLGDCF